MKKTEKIDFVILWVDGADEAWRHKKAVHTGLEELPGNTDSRYRDWDCLKYWFRGVEKFAPWVNNIYFITDDQKPEWLNLDHPKIKWVKHTDFIPNEYLPTFNSNVIEWNFNRIEGLSEQFVAFNDDMFLIDKVKPEDFFKNGLPCDLPRLGTLYPLGLFEYTLFNNQALLGRHFSLKKSFKNNKLKWIKGQSLFQIAKTMIYMRKGHVPHSVSWHIHTNFLKKNFDVLWDKEREQIDATCKNKLRSKEDVTLYSVRDWQLFSGEFYPKKPIGKEFATASLDYDNKALDYIKKQKGKIVCLNDTESENNFEEHKKLIIDAFESILPEKSSFEL